MKDGEYFVGYFQPSRVPADRNPNVRPAPDVAPGAFADAGGAPVVQRVTIVRGAPQSGIDFTITNIGNEQVEGPESGAAALPPTGSLTAGRPEWLQRALVGSVILLVAGLCSLTLPALRRARR